MKKKSEHSVVHSFPYWVEPPAPGQDLRSIDWCVMEVLSDKTLRIVETNPDPKELEALITALEKERV